ncbi:MAG: hypothetical protein IJX46_01730 [Clostridia bacterium]|nr:hypothetical protein [Clostridia bacterium]
MIEKYSLPFIEPVERWNQNTTFSDLAIKVNLGDRYLAWENNRYINCTFVNQPHEKGFYISLIDDWSTWEGVIIRQIFSFDKETYLSCGTDTAELLKKCIASGSYVLGNCNGKYIDESYEGVEDRPYFSYMLTGFDDEKGTFTVKGVDHHFCYRSYEVKYRTFVDSIFDICGGGLVLELRQFNPDVEILPNIPRCIAHLEDYIGGTSREMFFKDRVYGIAAVEALGEYCADANNTDREICGNLLDCLADHKMFMRMRVEYWAEQGWVNNSHIKRAREAENMAYDAIELNKKYIKSGDGELLARLNAAIKNIMYAEKQYLPQVLDEIKSAYEIESKL